MWSKFTFESYRPKKLPPMSTAKTERAAGGARWSPRALRMQAPRQMASAGIPSLVAAVGSHAHGRGGPGSRLDRRGRPAHSRRLRRAPPPAAAGWEAGARTDDHVRPRRRPDHLER